MIKDYRILVEHNPCIANAPYEWKLLVTFMYENEDGTIEDYPAVWHAKEDGEEQTLEKAWQRALAYYKQYAVEWCSQEQLKELWNTFINISKNQGTEETEEEFLCYPAGTHREEICHWFDKRYNGGVTALMGATD